MAEENKKNEAEELATEAAETVEETAAAAEDAVTEAAEKVQELDEKVETAVANVAAEAEEAADAAEQAVAETEAAVEDKAEAVEDEPKKRERRSKQARAEKEAQAVAGATQAAAKSNLVSMPQCLAASAVCLGIGLLLGKFVLGGSAPTAALVNKTTVTENELNTPIATYTYDGKTYAMPIREVIEQGGRTIESADKGDGTYAIPSAEECVNIARQAIQNKEIEARNIQANDDEVKEYAKEKLGTEDYEAIGSQYGMEADKVKDIIGQLIKSQKLQSEVVGEEMPETPEAPAQAEEGKEEEVKKEYGEYIIKLAGDQWDAEKGAWKDKESSYAKALADYEVSADKGASYKAAQAAYFVAYQDFSAKQTELGTKWSDFLNGLLSKGAIQVNSLVTAAQ